MKVRALIDRSVPVTAWQEWRIINPFRELRRHGLDFEDIWLDLGEMPDSDTDILVLPRVIVKEEDWERTEKWFNDIKSRGTKLVFECDDDIFSEDYVSNISKIAWDDSKPIELYVKVLDTLEDTRRNALWTVNQCNAITVPTKTLGLYIQSLTNVPVYVIENAISRKKFERGLLDRQVYEEMLLIGWAGGNRNYADLEIMFEAWIKIAEKYKNVGFVLGGYIPKPVTTNQILLGRTLGLDWKPTSEYAQSMNVDIGCCAVSNSPFSLRKSPIKAWEFGLAGAAIVASKNLYEVEPTLLLADNVDEWILYLSYLIENKEFRELQAHTFKTHVICYHDLRYQYIYWQKTYEDIVNGGKEMEVSETWNPTSIHASVN